MLSYFAATDFCAPSTASALSHSTTVTKLKAPGPRLFKDRISDKTSQRAQKPMRLANSSEEVLPRRGRHFELIDAINVLLVLS